jgi:hypothetical protein
MFLGLPDPDPLVRDTGTNPDPDQAKIVFFNFANIYSNTLVHSSPHPPLYRTGEVGSIKQK